MEFFHGGGGVFFSKKNWFGPISKSWTKFKTRPEFKPFDTVWKVLILCIWMYNKYKTISALFGNESVADAENISGEASHTKKIQGLAWPEFLNFLYVLVSWGGWARTPAPWIRQSRVIFIIFRGHLLFRAFYAFWDTKGGGVGFLNCPPLCSPSNHPNFDPKSSRI